MVTANAIVMPKLGLTMSEGILSVWMVAVGDKVDAGQILFVVETDKLATEVEAPGPGEILELIAEAGATYPVGEVIARWSGEGATDASEMASVDTSNAADSATTETTSPNEVSQLRSDAHIARTEASEGKRVVATPLARRISRLEDVDLKAVIGSGANGRIKARDVQKAAEYSTGRRGEIPGDPTRKTPTAFEATVARRLSEAKRDIPHFYLAAEANVGPMLSARKQLNADESGHRLSVNHFVLAAVARTWADHPLANRIWEKDEFLSFSQVDVGLAVDTSRGLFAPVIRNAGFLRLDEIALAADRLAQKARDGHLELDNLAGGAVTVSNVGRHAVSHLTPIINPGQSAILGVGRIRKNFAPDEQNQPVCRDEIGLVLACDHRVFSGVAAAKILESIVCYLEMPVRLLSR